MEFPYVKHPSTLMVCGPSNCGKTYFVRRLINEEMINPMPKRIVWCYGAYQRLYDEMPNVEFYEGLPADIQNLSDALVVIDDLMTELGNNEKLANLFTKGSHHRNLSVIFIVQNIFHQGKEMRNISLNTSYMCCFKNVRDQQQINCLAKQMFPNQVKYFLESFNDATKQPYGYLFLDLRPCGDERLRLRTNIFMKDEKNIAYFPKNHNFSLNTPNPYADKKRTLPNLISPVNDVLNRPSPVNEDLKNTNHLSASNESTIKSCANERTPPNFFSPVNEDLNRAPLPSPINEDLIRPTSILNYHPAEKTNHQEKNSYSNCSNTSKYACSKCHARFAYKHHMKRHLKSQHGSGSYQCYQCRKILSREDALRRHMMKHDRPDQNRFRHHEIKTAVMNVPKVSAKNKFPKKLNVKAMYVRPVRWESY